MRFYRVVYRTENGCNGGYSWHTTQRDAKTAARQAVENDPDEYAESNLGPPVIDVVDVEPNKAGILRVLTRYATEPNNG